MPTETSTQDENSKVKDRRLQASLGVLAVVGTFIVAIYTAYHSPAKIVVPDLVIRDVLESMKFGSSEYAFNMAQLDILMKNDGGRLAVVSGVELEIAQVWYLALQSPINEAIITSNTYSVDIDPNKAAPYSIVVPVAQSIKSDESDRISVNIRLKPLKPLENIFHMRCRLIYNSNKKTDPIDLIMVLPDLSIHKPGYFFADHKAEVAGQRQFEERLKRHTHSPNRKLFSQGVLPSDKTAEQIDKHNREILIAAGAIEAKRNHRADELIHEAKTSF